MDQRSCPMVLGATLWYMLEQRDVKMNVQHSQCVFELHFEAACHHTQSLFRQMPCVLSAYVRTLWSRIFLLKDKDTPPTQHATSPCSHPFGVWKRVSWWSYSGVSNDIPSESIHSRLWCNSVGGGGSSHSKTDEECNQLLLLFSFLFEGHSELTLCGHFGSLLPNRFY